MTQHASLGASSAYRWMNCPGSVNLSIGIQESESVHAAEGTAAHKLADLCLRKGVDASLYAGTQIDGFEVTVEMVDAVQMFLDEVRRVAALDPQSVVFIERQFNLDDLKPPARMFGTADAMVFLPSFRKLVVLDLKYGRGVLVEVEGNRQLRYYALGGLLEFEKNLYKSGAIDEVEIVIVQPRAQHIDGAIRSETIEYLDLVDWTMELLEAAKATQQEDAPLKAGPWCRWCRAKAICPAIRERAQLVAQVEFADLPESKPPAPETLPAEVLVEVLDNMNILEEWLTAVKAYAHVLLEQGYDLPGWKLVAKRAMRKWKDEKDALGALYDMGLSEDDATTTKIRSPAQIDAVMKRYGGDPKSIEHLYHKQSSGTTLVPESDSRPPARPMLEEFFEEADPQN